MPDPARKRLGVPAAGLLVFLSLAAPARAGDVEPAHPVVAGFERFADDPKSGPVEAGLLLLGELNCTSCHRASPGLSSHLNRKQAPVLDGVGSRVRPEYLQRFLAAPHAAKPGTTMPDLLATLPDDEKGDAVDALTHFLASTGGLPRARSSRKALSNGRTLYQQVGCQVCHGPREGKSTGGEAWVPLGPLEDKYTIPSLSAFLADPLKSRPSGRMPGLRLKPEEATQVAQYLLREARGGASRPNVAYEYFEIEGSCDSLPDFARLTPTKTGQSEGFDVSVANRGNNYAIRFQGYLKIEREGKFRFILKSDDGSKLFLDDRLVVDNDGVHPPQTREGSTDLDRGMRRIVVEVFNASGEAELELEFEGPGLSRQPVAGFVSPTEEGPKAEEKGEGRFAVNPDRAAKGRELFARVGCASCHQIKAGGKAVEAVSEAPPLEALDAGKGCLAASPGKASPRFDLNDRQRSALAAALGAVATLSARQPTPAETITRSLTAFNCYACHERDGRGGVEASRNAFFATTQKEMGDEGRLPPHLNGVGAKLNETYLKQVFQEGAKDRPYMLTRMPKFGGENGKALVGALTAVDHIEPVETPVFDETTRRVKSEGRFLVGGMALGCVKCHTFKGSEAEGVQAIDMTIMTRRLRHDWFHRYVINPPAFRPGTRMPTGWPDGKSMLPKVLGGDTSRQIEAVWQFLSDGTSAAEPYGIGREPMPLFVTNEAVIYRNFIQGGGSRAIGVGYPEKANLAFDANDLRLALIWQGGFMDASKHWLGRGIGYQPPMGDNVLALPAGAPFASLSDPKNPWPTQKARDLGYRFGGYRLDRSQRPTFLYGFGETRVEDFPEAVAGPKAAGLRRTLTLTSEAPADDLYFRAAVGESIRPTGDGWYLVNGEWKVRIGAPAEPVVRSSGGKEELLVPVRFADGTAKVVEQFEW